MKQINGMIKLHDLEFEPYLSANELEETIAELAQQIHKDYKDKTPVFVGVLNGSFMFLSDLVKHYPGPCEIQFVRFKSYEGTNSTGEVKTLLDFSNLEGKDLIIVEDIVDTGHTLEAIVNRLEQGEQKSYQIASLFLKPEAYQKEIEITYVGMAIPNNFIVGYGLDYNELGRNLPEIYQLKQQHND